MNTVKQSSNAIALPGDRRSRSIQVMKGLKRSVDTKMIYLFDGLCENAADALFEEQFGSTDNVALSRQFNITRALRVRAEPQINEFKTLMGQCWVDLLNRKDGPGFEPPSNNEVVELLDRYAERNRNHYKILLEELRLRFSVLVGVDMHQHPLVPINFYRGFWYASACLDLDEAERQLLMSLFNRFVMDRFGQILALVNIGLAEHGINPPPLDPGPKVSPKTPQS